MCFKLETNSVEEGSREFELVRCPRRVLELGIPPPENVKDDRLAHLRNLVCGVREKECYELDN